MTIAKPLVVVLVLAALAFGGCRSRTEATAFVVLSAAPDSGIDLSKAELAPKRVVRRAVWDGNRLTVFVAVDRGDARLSVAAPGACPLDVSVWDLTPGAVTERHLTPLFDPGSPYLDVGFDAPLSIQVRPACERAAKGSLEWRQVSGPPLSELRSESRGFTVSLRTMRSTLRPTWGIVPVSAQGSAEVRLQAMLHTESGDFSRSVRISAASRSRGLPNVAVGTGVLLGGSGWKLEASPNGSHAALATRAGMAHLVPDISGHYRLSDGSSRPLVLQAARYDETPLDCGRSSCHTDLERAAARSPMATVLTRLLGDGSRAEYPSCALSCHATGEPGSSDGGFSDVLSELGFAADTFGRARFQDLPRAAQRLGTVGCFACHGPGAIPEPEARWAVLRSDVCAVCHDAPPRYGHVLSWAGSQMARADRDPRARADAGCVRCHTTAGFLLAQGVLSEPRAAPEGVPPIGVACAACHAVHDHGTNRPTGTPRALLRPVRVPQGFDRAAVAPETRVCVACHAPEADASDPRASAAAIWLGVGGVDETGAALMAPSPHRNVANGCIGCHTGGARDVELGKSHGFSADRAACSTCHPNGAPAPDAEAALSARATALLLRLGGSSESGRPPHAAAAASSVRAPAGVARARRNVLLVLEDRGAAVHGLPYARALLDAAEKMIDALPRSQKK